MIFTIHTTTIIIVWERKYFYISIFFNTFAMIFQLFIIGNIKSYNLL